MKTGTVIALVVGGVVVVGGGYLLLRSTSSFQKPKAPSNTGSGSGDWASVIAGAEKLLGSAFSGSKSTGGTQQVGNSDPGSAGNGDNYDYGYNVDDLVNNDYGG
jgi:hypothetical protein